MKDSSNKKKNILIVGSSKLPIPAVKGGAVPNLIENIIKKNEEKKEIEITCLSCYDEQACKESKKCLHTKFIWAKEPKIVEIMDKFNYLLFKKIFHLSRLLSLSYFFHIIWFTVYVSKILKNNNYDYVVFENSIPVLHSLRLHGNMKKYKGKYYFHIHTVPRKYYFNKKLIQNSNSVICISEYVKKEIIKATKIDKNKFSILYNSIDLNLFKPQKKQNIIKIKQELNLPNDKKILLFAGRLCKDKGIDKVIEVVKLLNDDYILLIVGSNFYKTKLKSDFEEGLINSCTTIKDRIIFTGYIDYCEMPNIYNCADIVILPSMWEEPAGMTIIEAMACKKSVITTKSGGIPEYTGDCNCILLNKDNDLSINIVEAIKKLVNDNKYKCKISQNAYDRSQKFNLNYYYESFIKIIRGDK